MFLPVEEPRSSWTIIPTEQVNKIQRPTNIQFDPLRSPEFIKQALLETAQGLKHVQLTSGITGKVVWILGLVITVSVIIGLGIAAICRAIKYLRNECAGVPKTSEMPIRREDYKRRRDLEDLEVQNKRNVTNFILNRIPFEGSGNSVEFIKNEGSKKAFGERSQLLHPDTLSRDTVEDGYRGLHANRISYSEHESRSVESNCNEEQQSRAYTELSVDPVSGENIECPSSWSAYRSRNTKPPEKEESPVSEHALETFGNLTQRIARTVVNMTDRSEGGRRKAFAASDIVQQPPVPPRKKRAVKSDIVQLIDSGSDASTSVVQLKAPSQMYTQLHQCESQSPRLSDTGTLTSVYAPSSQSSIPRTSVENQEPISNRSSPTM
ncbi:hypothetical protein ACOME3_004920 [Neoechinorhynchus agilis]